MTDRVKTLFLLAVLLCCGGGNEPSPREKCEALFDVLCESVGECYNERNGLDGSSVLRDLCVERFASAGSCERAVAVTPSYDQCLDRLNNLNCDEFFDEDGRVSDDYSLPATCRTVIQVQPGG